MGNDPARLVGGLYMGSRDALDLPRSWDCVVSAAEEVSPAGVTSDDQIHLPLIDGRLCWKEHWSFDPVLRVVHIVVEHLQQGHDVLVVCHSGLNRSGLVCGLAMVLLGMEREVVIKQIRAARGEHALNNWWFTSCIVYPSMERLTR